MLDGHRQQPEISLTKVLTVNWLLIVTVPLAAGLTFSWSIAWAILVGALIATVSFILLKNDMTKVMNGPIHAIKLQFFIKYYLRLTALAVVLYILVRHGHINVFGLLVGLSTVVLGIVIVAVSQVKNIYLSGKEAV